MKPGLAEFAAALFRPLVGRELEFRELRADGSAGQVATLELVEVGEPASGMKNRPQALRAPFTLLFVLRAGELPMGGMLRMECSECEPSEIFVSRVMVPGKHGPEKYFEAVFG